MPQARIEINVGGSGSESRRPHPLNGHRYRETQHGDESAIHTAHPILPACNLVKAIHERLLHSTITIE
jgi:hypothetical protein